MARNTPADETPADETAAADEGTSTTPEPKISKPYEAPAKGASPYEKGKEQGYEGLPQGPNDDGLSQQSILNG